MDSGSPLIQGNGRNQKVVGIATIISGCSAGDLAIFLRLSSFMEDLSETKYWNDSYIPSAASVIGANVNKKIIHLFFNFKFLNMFIH